MKFFCLDEQQREVPIEQALQALGYAPSLLIVEHENQLKLNVARAELADLRTKYESCKTDLEEAQKDVQRWRQEANDAIEERLKTHEINVRLHTIIRTLRKVAQEINETLGEQ